MGFWFKFVKGPFKKNREEEFYIDFLGCIEIKICLLSLTISKIIDKIYYIALLQYGVSEKKNSLLLKIRSISIGP